MKHIFLIVIVLLLLYKTMLQKPEEGFSFTEKDIMSSYGLRGTLTRDKQGKICKIKPKKRIFPYFSAPPPPPNKRLPMNLSP